MKLLSLLGAALSLALPLLSAAPPAAAAGVNAIAHATGDQDPFVISWADTADGKLTIDDNIGAQIHNLFAGAQYIITDNGQLLLGQLKGNNLSLIVPGAAYIHNDANTYFVTHVRAQDMSLFLDGSVTRFRDDPSKGFAEFTLLIVGKQGATFSTHIEQDLQFVGTSSSPGNGNPILSVPSG